MGSLCGIYGGRDKKQEGVMPLNLDPSVNQDQKTETDDEFEHESKVSSRSQERLSECGVENDDSSLFQTVLDIQRGQDPDLQKQIKHENLQIDKSVSQFTDNGLETLQQNDSQTCYLTKHHSSQIFSCTHSEYSGSQSPQIADNRMNLQANCGNHWTEFLWKLCLKQEQKVLVNFPLHATTVRFDIVCAVFNVAEYSLGINKCSNFHTIEKYLEQSECVVVIQPFDLSRPQYHKEKQHMMARIKQSALKYVLLSELSQKTIV